jgi:hypothetical protein
MDEQARQVEIARLIERLTRCEFIIYRIFMIGVVLEGEATKRQEFAQRFFDFLHNLDFGNTTYNRLVALGCSRQQLYAAIEPALNAADRGLD